MKYLTLIVLLLSFTGIACSSRAKNQPELASAPATPAVAEKPAVSEAQVLSEHSLQQLSSSANLLRVVFDSSLEGKQDPGTELIGCSINGEQAQQWLNPTRALIDSKVESEREEYVRDPQAYRKARKLDTCQADCTCGVYGDVLDPIGRKDLKTAKVLREHLKLTQRLKQQASAQTPSESMSCARKQTWYCTSSLKGYVEAEAATQAAQ